MVILIALPFLSLLIQSHSSRDTIFFEQTDLYWEPPTSAAELYNQLAKRKYREIQRDQVRYYACMGVQSCYCTNPFFSPPFPHVFNQSILNVIGSECRYGWYSKLYRVYTHVVLKGDPYLHNKFCSSDSIPMSNMNR